MEKQLSEIERCEIAKKRGFTYNPETGILYGVTRKEIKNTKNGYIICYIMVDGKDYQIRGHRLAWFLYYGKLPNNQKDHINLNKTDNRISNLRDVTPQQNIFNRYEAKGYFFNKNYNKFQAQIGINGVYLDLGSFDNEIDARRAYLEAKTKYHKI